MISPFIQNKINFEDIGLENYIETSTEDVIDRESMDRRINELYIEELEKDISNKVKDKGFKVNKCKVDAKIEDNVENKKIEKILLEVENDENKVQKQQSIEDKIVTEIQAIKKVNMNDKENIEEKSKVTNEQKNELKSFLIQEYGVNERCLTIN